MKKTDIIDQIRCFNRFYTSKLGILNTQILQSEFNLTEGRIIYEIGSGNLIARDLMRLLAIDEGYLSRLISKLEDKGVIDRKPSPFDQRKMQLHLTAKGTKLFNELNRNANQQIETLIEPLKPDEKEKLLEAITTVQKILYRN